MKKRKHGGRRKGAGRKPKGRKGYLIRLKPEKHAVLKATAERENISNSELVERMIDNLG